MTVRKYAGPAIDGTYQHISEAPAYQEGDAEDEDGDTDDELEAEAEAVVYVTEPEPEGEERTENVPIPGQRPDVDGQSDWDDWGWSG